MISKRLTWSSTRFFVKETSLLASDAGKEVTFKSKSSCPSLMKDKSSFSHHGSTEECLVATRPLWLDTILLRMAAARARERGDNKAERKKCCVVYCCACVGSHHSPVFLKHIQRQLWQEERQAVREWQRKKTSVRASREDLALKQSVQLMCWAMKTFTKHKLITRQLT